MNFKEFEIALANAEKDRRVIANQDNRYMINMFMSLVLSVHQIYRNLSGPFDQQFLFLMHNKLFELENLIVKEGYQAFSERGINLAAYLNTKPQAPGFAPQPQPQRPMPGYPKPAPAPGPAYQPQPQYNQAYMPPQGAAGYPPRMDMRTQQTMAPPPQQAAPPPPPQQPAAPPPPPPPPPQQQQPQPAQPPQQPAPPPSPPPQKQSSSSSSFDDGAMMVLPGLGADPGKPAKGRDYLLKLLEGGGED